MIRFFRRLWAKWTHRHDWVVIYRTEVKVKNHEYSVFCHQEPTVLERCYCGQEQCRAWDGKRWREIDLAWFDFQLAKRNIEIPARTHGFKP